MVYANTQPRRTAHEKFEKHNSAAGAGGVGHDRLSKHAECEWQWREFNRTKHVPVAAMASAGSQYHGQSTVIHRECSPESSVTRDLAMSHAADRRPKWKE
jgi:hypothetical protein